MTDEQNGSMAVVERWEDIPRFANEAEEATFWSTHALGERLLTRRGPRPGSLAEKLSKLRFQPHTVYSRDADAVYVYLRWGRGTKAKKLDQARLVDFADDGAVIGVQFLGASRGIDLRGIPERWQVATLLEGLDLPILG